MAGKVDDRIHIDSGKVGIPAREGEILEVIESPSGAHYRVRCAGGHETDIRPAGGSALIIPAVQTMKRKRPLRSPLVPSIVQHVTWRMAAVSTGSSPDRSRHASPLARL